MIYMLLYLAFFIFDIWYCVRLKKEDFLDVLTLDILYAVVGFVIYAVLIQFLKLPNFIMYSVFLVVGKSIKNNL